MRLISVYEHPRHVKILYDLLAEREPYQSISHREMPTYEQHEQFVGSMPYMGWWLINIGEMFADALYIGDLFAGACYITKRREIGVHVFKGFRGEGYGRGAVQEVVRLFPGRVLANISPANEASAALFKSLGFSMIQHTYQHE